MIADSSFLISLFSDYDSNHEQALKIMEDMEEKIVVPCEVVSEVFTFFSYKHGVEEAVAVVERILRGEMFLVYHMNENEWLDAFEISRIQKRKMSFVDYQVAYLTSEKKQKLLCFDKQLNSLLKNLEEREKDGRKL